LIERQELGLQIETEREGPGERDKRDFRERSKKERDKQ
jgi:hypothetical protein